MVAASFLHREDCAAAHRIGVDHIMWGADYPHLEGTTPFSHEAIRMTFAGVARGRGAGDARRERGAVYGFDLDELDPLAERFGPTVDDVQAGLDAMPDGAASMAFRDHAPANV